MPSNVILAASFPTRPDQLFDMYLDPQKYAAFAGAPVTVEPCSGTSFHAIEGMLSSTLLHIKPKRLIVQTWRSGNWSSEAIDSILTLSFWPQDNGARIKIVHINVPDEDFAGVSQGWEKYYWSPSQRPMEGN